MQQGLGISLRYSVAGRFEGDAWQRRALSSLRVAQAASRKYWQKSCVATRVQLVLGRVPCVDADELYAGVRDIAWEAHVRPDATIGIRAHGTNANLRNTAFSALKAKDALCDRLRDVRGERPDVDAQSPDFEVDLAVHERRATVYLNLSGSSLHRRGYREEGVQTAAPLKETLAAGILMAAGWPEVAKRGGILVDPMCGSGTIAVEAALMAADVAPGIVREHWGFQGWLGHDEGLWRHMREEAVQRRDVAAREMCVLAGDIDAGAVAIARENVERAGVRGIVQLFCDDAERLGRHLRGVLKRGAREGMLATNPPYGERLGTQDDLVKSNGALATAVEALPEGWGVAIIAPEIGIRWRGCVTSCPSQTSAAASSRRGFARSHVTNDVRPNVRGTPAFVSTRPTSLTTRLPSTCGWARGTVRERCTSPSKRLGGLGRGKLSLPRGAGMMRGLLSPRCSTSPQ